MRSPDSQLQCAIATTVSLATTDLKCQIIERGFINWHYMLTFSSDLLVFIGPGHGGPKVEFVDPSSGFGPRARDRETQCSWFHLRSRGMTTYII